MRSYAIHSGRAFSAANTGDAACIWRATRKLDIRSTLETVLPAGSLLPVP